jgi:hypothetical protein
LRGRVRADFRTAGSYFAEIFNLIVSIHRLSFDDQFVIQTRQDLLHKSKRIGQIESSIKTTSQS